MDEEGVKVTCTTHAVDRLVERGGFEGWDRRKVAGSAILEVRCALLEGRTSTKQPRFMSVEGRRFPSKYRHEKWCRYVWNPDQNRCYILKRSRGDRKGVTIVTVMVAPA